MTPLGHTLECFHNLDIDILNAATKAVHLSAHLFYEKAEVKEKLHSLLLNKFATVKENCLKVQIRKILATDCRQRMIQMLNMVLLKIYVNSLS